MHTQGNLFTALFNAIFGRVGRLVNEDVVLHLMKAKCLPVLLYGLEVCPVKAKFHYTDPIRTAPDTDKVRAHCRRRAKFHYTDPTRTRPDPHGPARTFFAAKLRWVRAVPVGSV